MEIAIAITLVSIIFAAYQKGRTDGLCKDALPMIDDQFKTMRTIVDRIERRERDHIADVGKMVNHPGIPEGSGGAR